MSKQTQIFILSISKNNFEFIFNQQFQEYLIGDLSHLRNNNQRNIKYFKDCSLFNIERLNINIKEENLGGLY